MRHAAIALLLLAPPSPSASARCPEERDKCSVRFLTGHLTGGAKAMDTIVGVLTGNVARLVVDRTGLEGLFDFDLEWSPDQSAPDKLSIFTAVREQLGLKLESAKAPVDVLVIDHVERPTED